MHYEPIREPFRFHSDRKKPSRGYLIHVCFRKIVITWCKYLKFKTIFAALVEQLWDPLSAKQTRRLVTTIQGLICDYPSVSADSKQVQVCLNVHLTIPDTETDTGTDTDTNTNELAQNPMWICVGVCVCALWTLLYNSASLSGSVNTS